MQQKADGRHSGRAALLLGAALTALMLAGCDSLGTAPKMAGRTPTAGEPPASIKTDALLDIADRTRANGDLNNAVMLYRRALIQDNKNVRALNSLGETLNQANSPNEAAPIFDKAVSIDPTNAVALRGLGMSQLALDQPQLAIDQLNKSIAISPSVRAFDGLGVAEDLLGDFVAAKAAYEKGLALAPGDLLLRNNMGLSLALAGEYDAAIAMLRAVATDPSAGRRQRSNLALALALAGRVDQSAEIARIDLDDVAVKRNLAYYAQLRLLSPKDRAQALLRPGTQPEQQKQNPVVIPTPEKPAVPAVPVPPVQASPLPTPQPGSAHKAHAKSVKHAQPAHHHKAAPKHKAATKKTKTESCTPTPSCTPAPSAAAPAPAPAPSAEPAPAAPPASSGASAPAPAAEGGVPAGKHWAQIGMFRIESNANAARDRLSKARQDLIQGAGIQVDRIKLRRTHEIVYRVIIGPFDERSQAEQMCKALAGQKVDCVATR